MKLFITNKSNDNEHYNTKQNVSHEIIGYATELPGHAG